jgi:hypothetical protein
LISLEPLIKFILKSWREQGEEVVLHEMIQQVDCESGLI